MNSTRPFGNTFCLTIIILLNVIFAYSTAAAVGINGGHIDFGFPPQTTYPPIDLDLSDGPGLIFQPDGKILAVGKYSPDTNLNTSRKLYRFERSGRFDSDFDPYYPVQNPRINGMALLPDGKIIYTYSFQDYQNYTSLNIIRLNPDGTRDETFNYDPVYRSTMTKPRILVFPDSSLWIGNGFTERGDFPRSYSLLRILPNGAVDTGFLESYTSGGGAQFHLLSDGKILKLGSQLIRLNPDTTPDNTFVNQPNVSKFHRLPDGKLYISRSDGSFARLFPNGSIDPSFSAAINISGMRWAVRPNGQPLFYQRRCVGITCRMFFQSLKTDGSFDSQLSSRFINGTIFISPTDDVFAYGAMSVGNKVYGLVRMHINLTPTRRKAFDFDGDQRSDLAIYRPSEGNWHIRSSSTNEVRVIRFGIAEDIPSSADYDGDNIADIAVFRPSTGFWYILRSSDSMIEIAHFGLPGDIPVQHDYDGDNIDDIAVYRPSDGFWYARYSSDSSIYSTQYGGAAGDKPAVGDYDGDGKADPALWRTGGSARWDVYSSITSRWSSGSQPYFDGDQPTLGDFDEDGRIDRAFFREFSGSWFGFKTLGSGFYFTWGARGDVPVLADYDGDDRDDLAVWRPSTGAWWIGRSSDGSYESVPFGIAGDIPVQASFNR